MPTGLVCMLIGGPTHTIRAGGRAYRFEMHPQMGPNLVTKNGDVLKNQPGPRSLFWRATELWDRQGQRLDDDGVCVWDEPPTTKVRYLVGRQYEVIQDGGDPLSRIEVVK